MRNYNLFMGANDGKRDSAFCYFPFVQLLLRPEGIVNPCCWNQDYNLGEIQKESLFDIWNGEAMRALRREFLEGNPKACEQQIRHMKCHLWSHRFAKENLEIKEIQSAAPKRMDLRLNGRCNLKCIMCEVWQQPNGIYDESDFWSRGPKEIFPFLIELDVLGGEPFIQVDTFRLMREVSAVNKKCTWSFVTNGQYRFRDSIRLALDQIEIRWVQVSVDSLRADTYAKIRPGSGDLGRVIRSLEDFRDYRYERRLADRPMSLTVSMCVQKDNWHEVGDFLDYVRSLKLEAVLQFAYQPMETSLLSFPENIRLEIAEKFLDLTEDFPREVLDPVLLPVLESLPQPASRLVREVNPS